MIYNLAGGLRDGRKLQAVLIGGAAGAFLRPDEIDVSLGFQSLAGTINKMSLLHELGATMRDASICGLG